MKKPSKKKPNTTRFKSWPERHYLKFGTLYPHALKVLASPSNSSGMPTIHSYDKRLEGYIKAILGLKNGRLALSFLNHLKA